MARSFRRPRSSHPIAELNVTNLIDLGFMLLIIFMIVANPAMQKQQTVPVNLPTVSSIPPSKPDTKDHFLAVGVDARGRYYIENKNVPLTLTQLQSQLRGYARQPNPPVIRIQGDASAPYQKVADVLAEVQKAGLSRVSFDSESKE